MKSFSLPTIFHVIHCDTLNANMMGNSLKILQSGDPRKTPRRTASAGDQRGQHSPFISGDDMADPVDCARPAPRSDEVGFE